MSVSNEDPVVALFNSIRPGDKVTILRPSGRNRDGSVDYKQATGRAVICGQARNGVVALNMGGRYGTPGCATVDNLVAVRKGRS